MTRTTGSLACLLLAAGSYLPAAAAESGPAFASRCPCSVSSGALRQTCEHDARNIHGLMQRDCRERPAGTDRSTCLEEREADLERMLDACRQEHAAMVGICRLFEEEACRAFRERLPVVLEKTTAAPDSPAGGRNWSFRIDEGDGRVRLVQVVTADGRPALEFVCAALRETVLQDDRFVEETYGWYAKQVDGGRWELRGPEEVEECLVFALESSELPEDAERGRDP